MAKAARSLRPETGAVTKAPAVQAPLRAELIDATQFSLIGEPTSLEAIRYNLRDEKISEFDLDRVKVPAGGATVFQVPTLEGIANQEAIEGIILHVGVRRSFWEDTMPSNNPPDCYSIDGLTGLGDPGGDCANCPFNEFGSAVRPDGSQGRGKRCKERRLILLLRPEDRLPLACSAPPASIKGIKQFLMRLPVPMYQAVVRLTLVGDRSQDGVQFSKVVPEYLGYVSKDHGNALKAYAETLRKAIIAQAPQAAEAFDDDQTVEGSASNPQGGDGAAGIPD